MHQVFASLALLSDQFETLSWGRLWEVTQAFLASVVALAAWLMAVAGLGQTESRSQTESFERWRAFWKVESSLRLPDEDVSEWVRATGRVPLEHVHKGSVLSKFVSRGDGLMMRPSNKKPAFLIHRWQHDPDGMRAAGFGIPPHGGFIVRVWLHPGEHQRHLRKSMRAPAFRQTRCLAFCSLDQLTDSSAQIQCLVVQTPEKSMKFDEDEHGPFIEMNSADPLLSDFGHRKRYRREDVPPNTIWMVKNDPEPDTKPKPKPERDPKPPAGNRWCRLFIWPRWFFLPSLAVAIYLSALLFVYTAIFGQEAEHVWFLATTALLVVAVQVYFILVIDMAIAIVHLVNFYIERSWGSEWTAGTTGCVEDARKMRNGHPPSPDTQGADGAAP